MLTTPFLAIDKCYHVYYLRKSQVCCFVPFVCLLLGEKNFSPSMSIGIVCMFVCLSGLKFVINFVITILIQSFWNFYHIFVVIRARNDQLLKVICQRSRSRSPVLWFSFFGHNFVNFNDRDLKPLLNESSEQDEQFCFYSFFLYLA